MKLSEKSWQIIVEADRGHNHTWIDVAELNYWAVRVGFQKAGKDYHLIEV